MVQRGAGHDGIHPAGQVITLELDLTVGGPLRCFGVHPGRLVTGRLQHGDEATQRPAADLHHPGPGAVGSEARTNGQTAASQRSSDDVAGPEPTLPPDGWRMLLNDGAPGHRGRTPDHPAGRKGT